MPRPALRKLFIFALIALVLCTQCAAFRVARSLSSQRVTPVKLSIADITISLADGLDVDTLNALGDAQNLNDVRIIIFTLLYTLE